MNEEGDAWPKRGNKVTYGQTPEESYSKPKARRSKEGSKATRMQGPEHSENVAKVVLFSGRLNYTRDVPGGRNRRRKRRGREEGEI